MFMGPWAQIQVWNFTQIYASQIEENSDSGLIFLWETQARQTNNSVFGSAYSMYWTKIQEDFSFANKEDFVFLMNDLFNDFSKDSG
jgi:hypothetical protein